MQKIYTKLTFENESHRKDAEKYLHPEKGDSSIDFNILIPKPEVIKGIRKLPYDVMIAIIAYYLSKIYSKASYKIQDVESFIQSLYSKQTIDPSTGRIKNMPYFMLKDIVELMNDNDLIKNIESKFPIWNEGVNPMGYNLKEYGKRCLSSNILTSCYSEENWNMTHWNALENGTMGFYDDKYIYFTTELSIPLIIIKKLINEIKHPVLVQYVNQDMESFAGEIILDEKGNIKYQKLIEKNKIQKETSTKSEKGNITETLTAEYKETSLNEKEILEIYSHVKDEAQFKVKFKDDKPIIFDEKSISKGDFKNISFTNFKTEGESIFSK